MSAPEAVDMAADDADSLQMELSASGNPVAPYSEAGEDDASRVSSVRASPSGVDVRRTDADPVDLLKLFDVSTCGFLQCKVVVGAAKVFNFVSSPFVTYWASIDDDTLRFFSSETESTVRYSHVITTSTSVKVDTIDYLERGETIITICVSEDDVPQFYARSEDSAAMEGWIIAIIEKSRGPFASSENFDLPPISQKEDDTPKVTRFAGELFHNGMLKIPVESSLFSNKQFYVELNHMTVSYWNSSVTDAKRDRNSATGVIQLDGYSRCFPVPNRDSIEFEFFVATKKSNGKFATTRFVAKDKVDQASWVEIINLCITKVQLQHDKIMENLSPRGSLISASPSVEPRYVSLQASKTPAPRLYHRDETAIGKIMNKIIGDSVDEETLKRFYLDTFCVPVRRNRRLESEVPGEREEMICVILYENQRYAPFKGFSVLSLIAGLDPAKLSSGDGVKFPDRYLRFSPPPPGYEWIGGSFSIDMTYTRTDKAGWTYASSFKRFEVHLAENRSLTDISHRKALVRRRRWVRHARLIDPSSKEPQSTATPNR